LKKAPRIYYGAGTPDQQGVAGQMTQQSTIAGSGRTSSSQESATSCKFHVDHHYFSFHLKAIFMIISPPILGTRKRNDNPQFTTISLFCLHFLFFAVAAGLSSQPLHHLHL